MSELILHENLRNSSKGDEVRKIADIWTSLTLSRVDKFRRHEVVAFLILSKLIDADNIVDLRGVLLNRVDLSKSDLTELNFSGANMTKANLSDSYLTDTILTDVDLSEANLSGATLTPEQLEKASSLNGATMPDGSIHP
jgi:uncharacterized protein YjbI with pentapeptide repeats